jgi:transposase-like protein
MSSSSILSAKFFHNEAEAFKHVEKVLWPNGPICPHCGNFDQARIKRLEGKSTRLGLLKCNECRMQFTVKVGTVFESAHVPLHKMLQAVYLMSCSKKGVSAHQLHRILQVTYKTAWFLAHRIREAMRTGGLAPMGGAGSIVEADETYFGPTEEQPTETTSGRPFKGKGRFGPAGKRAVLALVERGGEVRTFHVPSMDKATVDKIVHENIGRESKLHTDESRLYGDAAEHFAEHETVKHSNDEYVRTKVTWQDGQAKIEKVHTNSAEGYFSIFKRGMKGVYRKHSAKTADVLIAQEAASGGGLQVPRRPVPGKQIAHARLRHVCDT